MTPSSPSIAQIQKSTPEGLWTFLSQLPASFEAELFYGLVLAGFVGVLANFVKKWATGEITGGLVRYLFIDNVRGTWLSLFGAMTFAVGYIGSGIFMTEGVFTGWKVVLLVGFQNGFVSDVVANHSGRKGPVWTEADRDEKLFNEHLNTPKGTTP